MTDKEFTASVKYVAIDCSHFSTYSDAYVKILLQTGSEIDVVSKALCKEINSSAKADNIYDYQLLICSRFPDFENITVSCGDIDMNPWGRWKSGTPIWWKKYNGVKHNRNITEKYGTEEKENYKFANQETILNALAGLYQLELYLYSIASHNKDEETPLPGSRLFKLKDYGWENKHFGNDYLLYAKDDCIYLRDTEVFYSDI